MTETYTDGFFYHPKGTKPAAIAERIATGEVNPRLDDVFSVAIQETKDERRANAQRENRLLARIDEIKAGMKRLAAENAALDARLAQQHEAIAKYQQGDDLDEAERALLTPKCDRLARDLLKADADAEYEAVKETLPAGWEATGHRCDDDFIYVTIRRERVRKASPEESIRKKIQRVLNLFFAPDFDRQGRVQLWDRLGTLGPINPAAP